MFFKKKTYLCRIIYIIKDIKTDRSAYNSTNIIQCHDGVRPELRQGGKRLISNNVVVI